MPSDSLCMIVGKIIKLEIIEKFDWNAEKNA